MPEPFQKLVARATARDRSQRFQTVHEMADVLRRLVHAPVSRRCETPTILVIEDDDTLRDTLEVGLLSESYRVLKAGDGREGIRLAAEAAPHLVLLDVTLPGMNGFDVCRELRQKGFTAPIIMVTGRAEEVDCRGPGDRRRRLSDQAIRPARAGGGTSRAPGLDTIRTQPTS